MYTRDKFNKLMEDCGPVWNDIFKQTIAVSENNTKINYGINELIKKYNDKKNIYPSFENIFKQFKQCSLYEISVIIFGYKPTQKPNLNNIIDELYDEYKYTITKPNFKSDFKENYKNIFKNWNQQGVLTLYYCLTYDKDDAKFHTELWRMFMNDVIKTIQLKQKYIVFLLWENGLGEIPIILREDKKDDSKKIKTKNDKDKRKEELTYYLLQRDSTQVRNNRFQGCNHFIITNHYLTQWFKPAISWI